MAFSMSITIPAVTRIPSVKTTFLLETCDDILSLPPRASNEKFPCTSIILF